MDEKRIRQYAKYSLYDEITKIEDLINSKKLDEDEEMILADKLMQYKKEYVYIDELDEEDINEEGFK